MLQLSQQPVSNAVSWQQHSGVGLPVDVLQCAAYEVNVCQHAMIYTSQHSASGWNLSCTYLQHALPQVLRSEDRQTDMPASPVACSEVFMTASVPGVAHAFHACCRRGRRLKFMPASELMPVIVHWAVVGPLCAVPYIVQCCRVCTQCHTYVNNHCC